MDAMARKKPRPRRSFTAEFKAEIVERCLAGDRTIGQVARDFDLTETAVREWVKQAQLDDGTRGDGLTSTERAELAVLRRENRQLCEDVEILKRARLSSPRRPGERLPVHRGGDEAEKVQQHSVKRACELMEVSRSAYYAHTATQAAGGTARHREDTELSARITEIHDASGGTYGAPRVHAELAEEGRRHGRKRVARLMRAARLRGKTPRRWRTTTIPDPAAHERPDLIGRDFTPNPFGLDQRWCGDVTYIRTWEGWAYLATVIDIASRRVVGWAVADHLRTDLVEQALRNAVTVRRPAAEVIFHSDRGCQYTSAQFTHTATELGVTLSVGRTGQCWDNALAESFFATIKTELLESRSWRSHAAVRTAVFDYIEGWYNTRRRHSTLGCLSPTAYEATAATPAA